MPVRYPREFLSRDNFVLAWERIRRGSNIQYKRFFSHLYPSYHFAHSAALTGLRDELRRGTYQPSPATTIYFPKVSRILRPITLLCLNDQIVYQSIVNVIANRFFAVLRPDYEKKAFGALYTGRNSKFFYRPWKQSYRAYNVAIERAFRAGNDILADFDLVSFFDLIDHTVLRSVLRARVKSGELLDLLISCLGCWTKGNPDTHSRGHGIPQGPEASAFLAEVFLHEFDKTKYDRVRYLRYVDDVKLLGKKFSSVRRALVRLDLRSKALGLVPQAQKIEIRRLKKIGTVLKSVPSSIAGETSSGPPGLVSKASRRRLEKLLKNAVKRKGGQLVIANETHFKFALYRLPPSMRTLRLIHPLFETRPDLSDVLARYASNFSRKSGCAGILHRSLRRDPVFDAAAGDMLLALDRCSPRPEPKKFKALISRLVARSEERSLLLRFPAMLYLYKRAGTGAAVASLKSESSAITAGMLIHHLAFDRAHASMSAKDLAPAIRAFALASDDADLARYCTYLMLAELKLIPGNPRPAGAVLLRFVGLPASAKKQSLLVGFMGDFFRLVVSLDWEELLGKRAHSEAQRRCIEIRGHWTGNPTVLITAVDSFNDLLLQRFSVRHPGLRKAFRSAAGKRRFPNLGNWLRNKSLTGVLTKGCGVLADCHDLRIQASLAHARQQKTGRFTRPISYRESDRILKRLSGAYRELFVEWAKI
jgi:hypothetical protein